MGGLLVCVQVECREMPDFIHDGANPDWMLAGVATELQEAQAEEEISLASLNPVNPVNPVNPLTPLTPLTQRVHGSCSEASGGREALREAQLRETPRALSTDLSSSLGGSATFPEEGAGVETTTRSSPGSAVVGRTEGAEEVKVPEVTSSLEDPSESQDSDVGKVCNQWHLSRCTSWNRACLTTLPSTVPAAAQQHSSTAAYASIRQLPSGSSSQQVHIRLKHPTGALLWIADTQCGLRGLAYIPPSCPVLRPDRDVSAMSHFVCCITWQFLDLIGERCVYQGAVSLVAVGGGRG